MCFQRVVFAIITAATCAATLTVASEPASLDGTWLEVVEEPPRIGYGIKFDPVTIVIEGDLLTEKVGDRVLRRSLILFPSDEAGAIDYATVVGGEFWITKGLYKIEKGVLTISESTKDADRPKDFQKSDLLLERLVLVRNFERVKPSEWK